MKGLVTIIVFCISFQTILSLTQTLNGNDWFATNQNKSLQVSARVPGSIYTDLIRNNILIQDPYYGSNDFNYKWVSYDNWTFQKLFNVDETVMNKRGIYLICHGLDTISKIWLNNELIGGTDNMFIRYKFDIKPHLRLGQNLIQISFESAVTYAKKVHDQHIRDRYIIPPESSPFAQRGELHANYIRKMQSSFSWDWGPSFPTQGIWKNIEIQAIDSAIIRDISVNTLPQSNDKWILNTTLHFESIYSSQFEGLLQISIYNTVLYRSRVQLIPSFIGNAILDLEIPVNESLVIHKWYPNGMGSQMLYDLKVIFTSTEETVEKSVKIGFRTVELIQEPIKPKGLTFYFKINGLPLYAKGSNWIPAHVFHESLTTEYLRHLLQSTREANMNMLRVWGGGVYESDEFYQMADEMGILIWHDFMFACALYPTTINFLDSVRTEVTQQVRRLQHHPSIALWAGNNENEAALAQYWWPEIFMHSDTFKSDYITLYVDIISKIVANEDTSRPYLTSSPSNGLETIKSNWLSNDPQSNLYGDTHFYYYGTNAWDWQTYPSTKFSSEYGFQSFPSLKILSKVVNTSDLTYPLSESLRQRQHHTNGNYEITALIEKNMKLPVSGGMDRLNDFIYLSQISQAMALKTETEFYRRNRDIHAETGEGFTMGALYWQLNDIWPAPTWSSIEFGGKWKMSHYFVKNFFNNLLVVPFEDNNILNVAVIRDDYSGSLSMNLSIKVFKWSSLKPTFDFNTTISTKGFSSQIVYSYLTSNIMSFGHCFDRRECVIEVSVENQVHNLWANNFLFLSQLSDSSYMLKPSSGPKVSVISIIGPHNYLPQYVYDIVLETDGIALFVWLDFQLGSDIMGEFSDNGFNMFTNEKHLQFYCTSPVKVDKIKSQITIKSLTDVKTQ